MRCRVEPNPACFWAGDMQAWMLAAEQLPRWMWTKELKNGYGRYEIRNCSGILLWACVSALCEAKLSLSSILYLEPTYFYRWHETQVFSLNEFVLESARINFCAVQFTQLYLTITLKKRVQTDRDYKISMLLALIQSVCGLYNRQIHSLGNRQGCWTPFNLGSCFCFFFPDCYISD